MSHQNRNFSFFDNRLKKKRLSVFDIWPKKTSGNLMIFRILSVLDDGCRFFGFGVIFIRVLFIVTGHSHVKIVNDKISLKKLQYFEIFPENI